MFCLFRNSLIHPALNPYIIIFSLLSAAGWLYFTFIEKSLISKVFQGEALIVDLVFGLPLVLMMGVVIYATIYWTTKVLLMLLFPWAIILKSDSEAVLTEQLDDENIKTLEMTHGERYWTKAGTQDGSSAHASESDMPSHSNKTSAGSNTTNMATEEPNQSSIPK